MSWLKECLKERSALEGSVYWLAGKKLEFGAFKPEVIKGFEAIDAGKISAGVQHLARHEQLNILQPVMYDDPAFSTLMRADQFAWALRFASGSTQEIQLVLSNRCTADGHVALSENFSSRPLANLSDSSQRMAFVLRAAERFDRLLHDPIERHMMENSLYVIAAGGR